MMLAEDTDLCKKSMFIGRDMPWVLEQWSQRAPEKHFLHWEPNHGTARSWTFLEFRNEVLKVAQGLQESGIGRGERVLLHLDNCPEFLTCWFACAYIGASAVCTNTRSVAKELRYFSEHSTVVAVVTNTRYMDRIREARIPVKFTVLVCSDVVTDQDIVLPSDAVCVEYSEYLKLTGEFDIRDPDPDLEVGINYTSGTTSLPKAVVFTHANALWACQANASNFRIGSDDITLLHLPLYHINAFSYSMLSSLWVGGTIVLLPKFSASRFWSISMIYGCTWTSMIRFAMLAIYEQEVPDHEYKLWLVGISHPSNSEHFGVNFLPFWSMTETVSQGIVGDPNHPGPAMCIGRQAAGYDICIRDPHGKPVKLGSSGKLFIKGVRGVSLFKEYLNNPDANKNSFDGDWFDTGDIVRTDTKGNLFFADREKDIIRVGGENVSAAEVENVVKKTGLVGDCAVVAQRHSMLEEVPVVFVEKAKGAQCDVMEAIVMACESNLADFKVVRKVLFVEELPRNSVGKIEKKVLRDSLPSIQKE